MNTTAPEVGEGGFNRVVGINLLLLVPQAMLACAVAVRVKSAGPALFRQGRMGKVGETFRIWKLCTMYVDAEAGHPDLTARNMDGHDAALFRIHNGPHITRPAIARRPPPAAAPEEDRHDGRAHRRQLVTSGITGP